MCRGHLRLIIAFWTILATAVVGDQNADAETGIHFRTVEGFLVVVPITLEGAGPFDFVVDTGTNRTLIDPELVERMKLKPVGKERLATLTGSELVERYVLERVTLGEKSVSRVVVLGQRMDELHSLDSKIRGVLGLEFLARFAFLLDYRQRLIELHDPWGPPDMPGGMRVAIEIAESRILIPAISGTSVRGSWKLALDSGISQLLIFDGRMARLPDPAPGARRVIQVTTNLGSFPSRMVTVRDLEIGGQRLGDLQAVAVPASPAIQGHFEDGLLPTALFRSVFVNGSRGFAILLRN